MTRDIMTITSDGYGSLIAVSPGSRVELARVSLLGESTEAHISATRELVQLAYEALRAEGYPHAAEFLGSV